MYFTVFSSRIMRFVFCHHFPYLFYCIYQRPRMTKVLSASPPVRSLQYYQPMLNGHGCGIDRNIKRELSNARFLVKFIRSAILAIGSSNFQNVCTVSVTGSKKTINARMPAVGSYPVRMLKPPTSNNTPPARTADFGIGTPLEAANPLTIFNCKK